MDRNEFLKKLKNALKENLDRERLNEQLDYYDKYISDEVAKGREEKEVIDELGNPELIAKTIKTVSGDSDFVDVDTKDNSGDNGHTYNSNEQKIKRAYVYTSNTGVIGCAILFLIVFIILVIALRFLGILAIGTIGMAYGMGPFGILMILLLIWLLFGSRRQ